MLELQMHEAQILRREGKTIREIATILQKSERTIHNYLKDPPRRRKKREYPSKLDPYKALVESILKESPDYNRELLFEKLQNQGYGGGISILREHAARVSEEMRRRAVIRFETEPGFQAQVDWKELGKQIIDGKERKLYVFTMVFGYSRAPFVLHTADMKQSTLLACHVLAFNYFGGVPREVLYDNMKTAWVFDLSANRWEPNRRLLALAHHYGFTPRRCRAYRPQTKGKVERFIDYYSVNYWPRVKESALSLAYLNESALKWIKVISGKPLREFNESRTKRFARERGHLLPLPAGDFDYREEREVKVSRESLVLHETNGYSVPPRLIGESVRLLIPPLSDEVEVRYGSEFIRTFTARADKRREKEYRAEDKEALRQLWAKQLGKEERKRRDKSKKRADIEVEARNPGVYDELKSDGEVA